MVVYVFRGQGRVFGFTPAEQAANLPERFGPWVAFMTIDIHPDEPHRGVDVNECLDDIGRHGFHLTDAHVRITDKALAP